MSGRYLKNPIWKRGDPEADALIERKQRFHGLCDFVSAHHGWVTSVPGSKTVRIECLPGSALPATLERIGYKLKRGEDGTRILPNAITESFVQNADGALAASEGSTRPVTMVTHSAGIAPVERYSFEIP
jgi:hypothetical protein